MDSDSLPTIHTKNLSSLISDSTGIVRYRVEADISNVYSNREEPYTHFPEGIYLERFDSLLNIELIIKADTAYYYEKKGLWRAVNNVFIQNQEGHTVETSELFLNEKADRDSREAIYTDKFIKINQGNRITSGQGMQSNISFTDWRIYQSSHEMEVEDKEVEDKNNDEEK